MIQWIEIYQCINLAEQITDRNAQWCFHFGENHHGVNKSFVFYFPLNQTPKDVSLD